VLNIFYVNGLKAAHSRLSERTIGNQPLSLVTWTRFSRVLRTTIKLRGSKAIKFMLRATYWVIHTLENNNQVDVASTYTNISVGSNTAHVGNSINIKNISQI